ncbi:solute carrier family 13 (sodium-dependent citrate transporter) member 5 [Cricetulus griseus]
MRRRELWREKPEKPTGRWSFSSGTLQSPEESRCGNRRGSHAKAGRMTCTPYVVSASRAAPTGLASGQLRVWAARQNPGAQCNNGHGTRCAYVVILMAIYWCTDVIPVAVTSLLPVLLFPLFKILDSKEVCIQYMKDTNMLFLGSLIVAVAVERWQLHKRIALRMLLYVGTKPSMLMLGFMFITAFLSMWISNTATTAMMIPIVEAMLQQMVATNAAVDVCQGTLELSDKNKAGEFPGNQVIFEDLAAQKHEDEDTKNMYKAMNLCVCYAASIGGTATLTGTGPNVVLLGQMQELFPDSKDTINFASWFGFAFPNMVLMLVLSWLWLQSFYMRSKFKKSCICCGLKRRSNEKVIYKVLQEEYKKLGPLTYAEINVLLCFALLIILWFSRDPGFMPGWLSIAWIDGKTKSPSSTSAARLRKASGLSEWLAKQMEPLSSVQPVIITLVSSCIVAITTECTSNVATTTLFLPVFASMSRSIGIHPLYVMIPCTMSASLAFMLPVATPPNAIVFAYGHLKIIDMSTRGDFTLFTVTILSLGRIFPYLRRDCKCVTCQLKIFATRFSVIFHWCLETGRTQTLGSSEES